MVRNRKNKVNKLVNKNMTFEDILRDIPEASEIMLKKGMHCMGCSFAGGETIEQGAIMHGLDPKKLIDEINRAVKKKSVIRKNFKRT